MVETEKSSFIPEAFHRMEAALAAKRNSLLAISCTYAFFRVLILCAAFPLFNPVDEQDHFETVVRYSDGTAVGKELPQTRPDLARTFALYGSPEYLVAGERLRAAGMDVPITRMREDLRVTQFERRYGYWIAQRDMEAQSPPAYYIVASGWYRLGTTLGMKEWSCIYWVRGLNAILYALFVGVAALCVWDVFPQNAFLGVAVPLLLAVWPQDVFFGVNREVLSPLVCALVWFALFRGMMPGKSKAWLLAGAALSGTAFLTDVSNFVLFGSLAAVLALYAKSRSSMGKPERFAVVVAALLIASVPPLVWMARNRAITGDLTGSRAKVAFLGWTAKPMGEIWQHPIFSAPGAGYFGSELIKRYWRGEYTWGGSPMIWRPADWFYLLTSLIFVSVALFHLIREFRERPLAATFEAACIAAIVLSVLFLATISLLYDFHECVYPSRANPYFVSGRILCGTMLPFALLYLVGFAYLWRPIRNHVHPIVPVAIMCVAITVIEFALRAKVFGSAFNLFAHLKAA